MGGDASDPKRLLAELFRSQRLAVLATRGEAGPYASLVGFAASGDLRRLFFATDRGTAKFANLTADPRVALLVDDRRGGEADFAEGVAVTAEGRAAEAPADRRAADLATFLARLPHLRRFASRPDCALVCVEVAVYHIVTQFQSVVDFHPSP